jgi:hypothetical protein
MTSPNKDTDVVGDAECISIDCTLHKNNVQLSGVVVISSSFLTHS